MVDAFFIMPAVICKNRVLGNRILPETESAPVMTYRRPTDSFVSCPIRTRPAFPGAMEAGCDAVYYGFRSPCCNLSAGIGVSNDLIHRIQNLCLLMKQVQLYISLIITAGKSLTGSENGAGVLIDESCLQLLYFVQKGFLIS